MERRGTGRRGSGARADAGADRIRLARSQEPVRRTGPLVASDTVAQPGPGRAPAGDAAGAMNVVVVALAVAVAACVALILLRSSSAFRIERLEAPATAHLSSDDIARLANVGEGATLLTVDTDKVARGVEGNPWVLSVDVERVFPDTLRVSVTERGVEELVLMGSGTLAWYVGEGDVWTEPVTVSGTGSGTARDRAYAIAQESGALLVTDAPATVAPEAGSVVTDESLLAVADCVADLPDELLAQVVSFSAPDPDALSCVLSNGVEVSLGSATDADTKGEIVLDLLARHPGKITYINVRSITDPAYRSIDSDSVVAGTGTDASGTGTDDAAATTTGDEGTAGATATGA